MQRTATDTHHVSIDLISKDRHTLSRRHCKREGIQPGQPASAMGADVPFAAGLGRAPREALSHGRRSLSSSYRLFIQRAQSLEISALAVPGSALPCVSKQHSPLTGRPGLRKHRTPCEHSPSPEQEWRNKQSAFPTEHLGKSKTHALHILAHIRQHLCTEQALLPELESAMRRKAKPWAVVLQ